MTVCLRCVGSVSFAVQEHASLRGSHVSLHAGQSRSDGDPSVVEQGVPSGENATKREHGMWDLGGGLAVVTPGYICDDAERFSVT